MLAIFNFLLIYETKARCYQEEGVLLFGVALSHSKKQRYVKKYLQKQGLISG
jgi:hypothetical protein